MAAKEPKEVLSPEAEARFKEAVEQLKVIIAKRRATWRLTSVMEWEDCASHLLTRLWKQFGKYDPEQPLDRWANTVITNAFNNLFRDHYVKHARPCVAGTCYGQNCAYNLGDTKCGWTVSGEQDASCHFYANWLKRKAAKFAVATPLSMAAHEHEVHTKSDEHTDIDAAKKVIDDNIQRRLTKEEYRVYKLMYVEHLTIEETVKRMGLKKRNKDDQRAYMHIRNLSLRIKEIGAAILSEQGLIR